MASVTLLKLPNAHQDVAHVATSSLKSKLRPCWTGSTAGAWKSSLVCGCAVLARRRQIRSFLLHRAPKIGVAQRAQTQFERQTAESEELEAFCGRVDAEDMEVLLIGVAHRDGGVSERAARRLVERYQPDVCMVELDQVRFSWLLSSRRSLPHSYVPFRKEQQQSQPGAMQRAARQAAFAGLDTFSRAAGVSEGGGDEFVAAFEAAEAGGALVVPGDLPVARSLGGIAAVVKEGMWSPLQQLAEGFEVFCRAVGVAGRPAFEFGGVSAVGVSFVDALLCEDGGRSGPLVRSAMVGVVLVLILNAVMGSGSPESMPIIEEGVGQMLYNAASFLSFVLGLLGASGFAEVVWRTRDEAMAQVMTKSLKAVSRLQSVADSPKGTPGPLWCRWRKWSQTDPRTFSCSASVQNEELAAKAFEAEGGVGLDGAGSSALKRGVEIKPLHLPSVTRPQSRPGEAWMPVFTAKRPLGESEYRVLSLFEPRYLALVDDLMAAAGVTSSAELVGVRLALVHALVGSERPSEVRAPREDADADRGGDSGSLPWEKWPQLGIDVDAVLQESLRVAEIVSVAESTGVDGRRRCRIRVRGTEQTLVTRCCDLQADDLGALWLKPGSQDTVPLAGGGSPVPGASPVRRKVRGVAVVGLLHVNGIARYLTQKLAASPAQSAT